MKILGIGIDIIKVYRIEKAMVILAKLQEDVVERIHPELKTEWEEIVKELLSGNGNAR